MGITMLPNELLERFIVGGANVFEWGSGESTLWMAQRCNSVISIEHNSGYYSILRLRMPSNVDYKLIEPNEPFEHPQDGTYGQLKDYVDSIRAFPNRFDVVVIDGRARVACAQAAAESQRDDCIFLMHDWGLPTRESYYLSLLWLNVVAVDHTLALFHKRTDPRKICWEMYPI